jgi:hypothetical protein
MAPFAALVMRPAALTLVDRDPGVTLGRPPWCWPSATDRRRVRPRDRRYDARVTGPPPRCCRRLHVAELASANVVRGMLDSLAALGGPLVATVLATSGLASLRRVRRCVAGGRARGRRPPLRRAAAPALGPRVVSCPRFSAIAPTGAPPDHRPRCCADVDARLPDRPLSSLSPSSFSISEGIVGVLNAALGPARCWVRS